MSLLGVNFSIHREGLKFIGILAIISLIFVFISATFAWIFLFLTLFCAFFFRNPKRAVPSNKDLIVSPADGTVCAVTFEAPAGELGIGEEKRHKVSIFLSIFNVHINRMPIDGRIRNIIYQPGAFLNAALDKSSVFNEKNTLIVEVNNDPEKVIAFAQIAGMIARRIVCDVHEGQEIKKGETFGLIRFGSRCDIWLPVGVAPKVFKGQTMVGGESVIADMSDKKSAPLEGTII
jgi:phosphatidylserine decarboxylase